MIFINLFTLYGSIGLNDDNFNKGISHATEKAENFAIKIQNIFEKIGKSTSTGMGMTAKAAGELNATSIKPFTEYGLLTGVMETLFDDTADILNKFKNSFQRNMELAEKLAVEELAPLKEETDSLIESLGDKKLALESGRNSGSSYKQGWLEGVRSLPVEMIDTGALISSDEENFGEIKNTTEAALFSVSDNSLTVLEDMAVKIDNFFNTDLKNIFSNRFEEIKKIVLIKLSETAEKVMDILRKMTSQMDMHLKTEGYSVGRNFMQALGNALIDEKARLLAQALGVADAITDIFRSRQKSNDDDFDGSHATGLSYVPFDGYRAILHEGEGILTASENREYRLGGEETKSSGGQTIINQYFYGVKEEKTAFEVYRATQKAEELKFE